VNQYPPSHEHRLAVINLAERDETQTHAFKRRRATIERYYGALATVGGGLHAPPAWARRIL